MKRNKLKRKIVKEIKEEQGGKESDIWAVTEFQWQFVRKTITEGFFNSVRLPYLGKFSVSLFRLKKINNKKNGII